MKYWVKKIVSMLITLLIVSFLVFLAFTVIPGDPAVSKLGIQATFERLEALREEMGLNRPFLERYGTWLVQAIRGDFGTSYSYHTPVSAMVLDKLPITLSLTIMAFLLLVIGSIPLGIYTAKHEGGWLDRIILVVNQIIMAVPPFFAGILITYFFGLLLKWFQPGAFVSYDVSVSRFLRYLFFPAAAIAIPKMAMTVKLLRSALIDEAKKDYVRTAYSKGNSKNAVLYFHMLKNAMIPVVTFLAMTLTDMVAGSVIVEQVFSIPGLGRILITSISNRDYPVVEAIIILLAVIVVMVNLLSDILCRRLDPRISGEDG
ncbi:MAG: ABC transporter permease [Lachnospiraceae bacterium]